jgi:ATP-dependent protease ClpP protease subunit
MKNEPVRIIEGTAKPFERFWNLRSAEDSESGEPEIEFYGPISEYSWWGDEITPQLFKDDLAALGGGGPVTIRIHSPGGDVFAASAIRAMIADYPGKVTTRIDGLCASAATYVAMAGDHVVMQDSAFFMIHDPWTITIGGVEELKTTINFLKTIKNGIVETYQNKTHMEAEELERMMSNETWMTARQAQEKGFVDEVVSVGDAKPFKLQLQNMAVLNCLNSYQNVPEELLNETEWSSEDELNLMLLENVSDDAPVSGGEESDTEKDDQVIETEEVSGSEVEGGLVLKVEDENGEEPAVSQENDAEKVQKNARELRDYLDIFGPRGEDAKA